MRRNKLPRDLMGILFYVFGLVIGLTIKAALTVIGFVFRSIHTAFKHDQFNRRLRIAVQKTEVGLEPAQRALGREELRFLAATLGLTDAVWHHSVKLRRRMRNAVDSAGLKALEDRDLTKVEAGAWTYEVSELLFKNFDRHLLTDETSKKKGRSFRISKSKVTETLESNTEVSQREDGNQNAQVFTTNNLVMPQTSNESGADDAEVAKISTTTAEQWASEEPLVQ